MSVWFGRSINIPLMSVCEVTEKRNLVMCPNRSNNCERSRGQDASNLGHLLKLCRGELSQRCLGRQYYVQHLDSSRFRRILSDVSDVARLADLSNHELRPADQAASSSPPTPHSTRQPTLHTLPHTSPAIMWIINWYINPHTCAC
jgi:hypothetical protein